MWSFTQGPKSISQFSRFKANYYSFFLLFFSFVAVPLSLRDPSSQTRDRTQALGSESAQSQSLDRQEIP